MEFNTLTSTLTAIVSNYTQAYALVQPIATKVLASLALIEITLAALYLALDGGHHVSSLFRTFLKIGAWTYITTHFHELVTALRDSLIGAALKAGGGVGNVAALLDPSKVASYGTVATHALVTAMANVSTFDLTDAVIFGFMYLAIMATYLLIAVQIFLSVAEFYLISALAGVLIGFGVSKHFEFIAQKAIGAVFACSIKLMVLAFIIKTVEPILASTKFVGPEIKFNELWALVLTTGTIMLFTWTAPSLAASLLSGSPSMSAGGVAQAMMSGATMATGLGGLAMTAAKGVGSLAGIGAKSVGGLVGGATAGFAGSAGRGFASSALGTAGGAARAAAAGARNVAGSPFVGIRQQYTSGYDQGAAAGTPPNRPTPPPSSASAVPANASPSPSAVPPDSDPQPPASSPDAPAAAAAMPPAWAAHARRSLLQQNGTNPQPSPATPDKGGRE